MKKDTKIKDLVKRVNDTLRYYEKEYIELKRTPTTEKEVCTSFEHYIEVRFNMECCKIPELLDLENLTGGHLFSCTSIINPDEARRRFSSATVELLSPEEVENADESLRNALEVVKKYLGGTKISFNSVKQRIKITIDE